MLCLRPQKSVSFSLIVTRGRHHKNDQFTINKYISDMRIPYDQEKVSCWSFIMGLMTITFFVVAPTQGRT